MGRRIIRYSMDPREFGEELGITFEGTVMVKGVEFAEYMDEVHGTRYHLMFPDGDIDETILKDVYADGNYTKATLEEGEEVMVDDDGIHRQ